MDKLRVLIAGEHTILRQAVAALLGPVPDMEVIGETNDSRDAVRSAGLFRPALVLMDLSTQRTHALRSIRAIKRRHLGMKVIVMTSEGLDASLWAALEAGADGCVSNDETGDNLVIAIRCVARGGTYLSPGIGEQVAAGYRKHATT